MSKDGESKTQIFSHSSADNDYLDLSSQVANIWNKAKATFELDADLKKRHQSLKEKVASDVMWLTGFSLLATVIIVFILVAWDHYFIFHKLITPSDRLVSEKVLITMIGATIVQVGGAMLAIVYSFFKAPNGNDISHLDE